MRHERTTGPHLRVQLSEWFLVAGNAVGEVGHDPRSSKSVVAEPRFRWTEPMTKTVSIRPLRVTDAGEMAIVLADRDLYEFTGGEPPSRSELERRYAAQVRGHSADGTEVWINHVVVAGGQQAAVGYVQATVPAGGGPAEIAWVIGRPWQRHGYATRAASLLLEELRARGMEEIVAHIHPNHEASQRIARHLGLQPTQITEDGETRWVGRVG